MSTSSSSSLPGSGPCALCCRDRAEGLLTRVWWLRRPTLLSRAKIKWQRTGSDQEVQGACHSVCAQQLG